MLKFQKERAPIAQVLEYDSKAQLNSYTAPIRILETKMQISKLDPQIPVRKKVSLQATSTPRMGLQILDEEEDLKIKENMTNKTEDTIKSL